MALITKPHSALASRAGVAVARLRKLPVMAGAILLTACSLQPEYVRPEAPIAPTYPSGPAYASNNPTAESTDLPAAADIGWRDFFTDARLRQLIDVALQNNRDLRAAILNVEQTRAQLRVQSAALYPQVTGTAERDRSRTPTDLIQPGRPPELTSNTLSASISWEIDAFGQLRNLKSAALEQYLASVQGRRAAHILLISQVADQYLTLIADDALLEVTSRALDTARASYKIVKLQYDTGTASELELRQAETAVEQAETTRAAQVRARAQAENGLVALLGQPLPPETSPPIRLSNERILADIPAGVPSELIIRRPDVLQAEALLRAANADIGAARAAFFPHITLTGSAGRASTMLSGLFKAGSGAWSFAPALTQSIFDAGANRGNLEATKVRRDIGVAQYQKAIQTAFREVADGLAARGTLDDQIASQERFTAAERRRLELAQLLYTNGQASYLDVLTAQTALYDAEQALVSVRLQRLTNLVDLYRALGGGWREHTGL